MGFHRPTLDVVIVNWNSGDFLRGCLETIPSACTEDFVLNRVIVVDNASSDKSGDNIKEKDYPFILISNQENRGFAAACNQGASGSEADYLLFLNPDTRLYPGSLCLPIQFMENPEQSRVGICGIKLVDERGSINIICARFPTLAIFLSEMFGLSKFFPKRFPGHFTPPEELLRSQEVDHVIGAFFLIRKDLFMRLKGFDERFFVYFEEVDLSLRARNQGYYSYYLSEASATHIGRVSTRKASSLSLYYLLSSRIKYVFKNFNSLQAITLVILMFSVELLARLVFAIGGLSNFSVCETFSAYRYLVASFLRD